MQKSRLPLSLVQLGNRLGDRAHWEMPLKLPQDIGTTDLSLPAGSQVEVQVEGVAIAEGVSLSLQGQGEAYGQCVRCLDPLQREISFSRTEVYYYPDSFRRLCDLQDPEELPELDPRYQLFFPNEADLEPLLIDAVVPLIPYTVLCSADCPGLCPECGDQLAKLPADHGHDRIDPRWGPLAKLRSEK